MKREWEVSEEAAFLTLTVWLVTLIVWPGLAAPGDGQVIHISILAFWASVSALIIPPISLVVFLITRNIMRWLKRSDTFIVRRVNKPVTKDLRHDSETK